MKNYLIVATILCTALAFGSEQTRAQEAKPSLPSNSTKNTPQYQEWSDDFDGGKLDEKKWEKFTFEGGSGGKIEVKDGAAQIRSAGKTRAGIRTRDSFSGDRFAVEGRISKVGAAFPEPGASNSTLGFGTLTILFDGSGRNRIEWMLTSEGTLEAWAIVDGRGERLDNKKLATKMKNPVLLVVRKADEFSFYLNET